MPAGSGLSAVEALHFAAARLAGADEFITDERPGKPIYKSSSVLIVYLFGSMLVSSRSCGSPDGPWPCYPVSLPRWLCRSQPRFLASASLWDFPMYGN